MKSFLSFVVVALSIASSLGFAVRPSASSRRASPVSTTAMYLMVPAAVNYVAVDQQQQLPAAAVRSPLQEGVQNYLTSSSSSQLLSLQERHVPTAEEIAAKKLNVNILFWGGGFVAPFLATVFYFGFRFWEK